ncbi:MAG TPA: class I SAM-dependent methyltransferase [Streptosporangiaceae bacterium]|nr:class I SAM-dependent methyltransferase [Streptosporangiaceae bacterium]
MDQFPPLVMRAQAVARQSGFPLTREEAGPDRPSACLPGVGRFLAVLAAGCAGGRIGELGTGAGIGAAWIASAMPADCMLVTVEIDAVLASAARELLAADSRAEVITGDALGVIPGRGPFDLLFADSGVRAPADFAALVSLLRIGGRIVMDDVTPEHALPAGSPLRADDVKRGFFSGEPRLTWTEVVLPDLRNSLLVGTRTR